MKRIVLFLATNLAVSGAVDRAASCSGSTAACRRPGSTTAAARVLGRRRLHRRDHLAADVEADGEVVDRRARDRPAARRGGGVAGRDGARLAAQGGHRHARGRDLRRRAPTRSRPARSRTRRWSPCHGPAAVDEQGRGRGGARPRDGARRQRRHGHADADPGRREHVRRVPRARRRLRSSTARCSAPSAAPGPATSSP